LEEALEERSESEGALHFGGIVTLLLSLFVSYSHVRCTVCDDGLLIYAGG
jgi:hypothetical protein